MSEQTNTTSSHETPMAQNFADRRISLNMTPREALDFIQKLSHDDEFRSQLEKDSSKILAEHHIYIPLEQIPGQVTLPSKELLQKALTDFSLGELNLGATPPSSFFSFFWWFFWTSAKPPHREQVK